MEPLIHQESIQHLQIGVWKIKEAFGVCSRSLKIDMARVGESAPCLLQCIGPS